MLQKNSSLADLENHQEFIGRHIGPRPEQQAEMLALLGYSDMDAFIAAVVPASIRMQEGLDLSGAKTEAQAIAELRTIANKNQPLKSFIGQGYYGTHTPNVILRNVLENPAWYTAYTPYQPEISQGRLQAVLNFQTMIADLTGMDLANASMLDEGTAAAEAMTLCQRMSKSKAQTFFIDSDCFPQTIDVVQTRAKPLDIEVVIGNPETDLAGLEVFGALLQYPGASGEVRDFSAVIEQLHSQKALVAMAADLLSLMLLKSPGDLGADVAIGCAQRFGVPLGAGGPHAAYMATCNKFKRSLPGRLVGASIDSNGKPALRLALQTREQHIRREKATSNICTAQVLLAVMASMYAVYHGPKGLLRIAQRTHVLTCILASGLDKLGFTPVNGRWFDTLTLATGEHSSAAHQAAVEQGLNLRVISDSQVGISLDETSTREDVTKLWQIFAGFSASDNVDFGEVEAASGFNLSDNLLREDDVLTHPVFNSYHSETELLRYLRKLSDLDIALDRAMIPLGSCTMKLNATAEMLPVTWPEFGAIHPFAPVGQTQGYAQLVDELEQMLCAATGYDSVSIQPNAGSQGEYAGLLAIQAYHQAQGQGQRNICLIPSSAHGTNPASAQMCGLHVVVVKCDVNGNVDLQDLADKAELHSENLAAIMITYPSTHGVFEQAIGEIESIIHRHGGQVYIDGANLNAMVGLCQPGKFGGDVSHLNLHKTFCIPHGGGGPGVGPVAVAAHLAPFLPGHGDGQQEQLSTAVSSARWGSASILPITWMYIKMMGAEGLKAATETAILNANYIAKRLQDSYPVLYTGSQGLVAHECILDVRPLKDSSGISVDDIAKRLIDYGFHAPTMSFPVPGTLMVEPTESEPKQELDRFCDAMIAIRAEIAAVENGGWSLADNPLVNSPHTADVTMVDEWSHSYSREQAVFPIASLRETKYWPPVARVDNVYGDKNLMCSCLPMSEYE